MAIYTALFDANVLYSMPVTDVVMELASTRLFRARWSESIHQEWIGNLVKNRPDIPEEKLQRRKELMDKKGRSVTGYQHLIDKINLPDPSDAHVLAAAIVGRADVIVTFNTKDFPDEILLPYGIECQHPDVFLYHQYNLSETLFIGCIKEIRKRLTNPKYTPSGYIDLLKNCGLPSVADQLKSAIKII